MAKAPNRPTTNISASAALAVDRARIKTILLSDEAKLRPEAALKLALDMGLESDSAIELLASMPQGDNPFVRAMNAEGPLGLPLASQGPHAAPGSKEARLLEISGSMKHFNASRGYTAGV